MHCTCHNSLPPPYDHPYILLLFYLLLFALRIHHSYVMTEYVWFLMITKHKVDILYTCGSKETENLHCRVFTPLHFSRNITPFDFLVENCSRWTRELVRQERASAFSLNPYARMEFLAILWIPLQSVSSADKSWSVDGIVLVICRGRRLGSCIRWSRWRWRWSRSGGCSGGGGGSGGSC